MKTKFYSNIYAVLIMAFLLVASGGCGSGGGGNSGEVGGGGSGAVKYSIATRLKGAAPVEQCPTGGISLDIGIDDNGNSVLDTDEVDSVQYVCNGSDGTDGTDALSAIISITDEPAGANCANGGKKVSAGNDDDSNGSLDAGEVDSESYICNGENGADGTKGADGTDGEKGTDGSNGSDGADGVTGSNGLTSLIGMVTEPSGTNCVNGGQKVTSGIDENSNNILDAAEVASTNYICKISSAGGGGFAWVEITGTAQQAEPNAGYMANSESLVTITLPASPALGDIVKVSGIGSGGWRIAQNKGQSIVMKEFYITDSGVFRDWSSIASSADSTKLVAVVGGMYNGQIYTSTDSGATWTARETDRHWSSVASSSDGSKLVALVGDRANGGQIYTSADSGITWTPRETDRSWQAVASSSDGTKLVAVVSGGQIYTSADSGITWTPRETDRSWQSVASSSDGTKLVAVAGGSTNGGQIYTSADSGITWTPHETDRFWKSVASSADGTKLVAVESNSFGYGGWIYTSVDSGITWTTHGDGGYWVSVASSSDGTKLVAVAGAYNSHVDNQLYISSDSGIHWTAVARPGATKSYRFVALSADGTRLVVIERLSIMGSFKSRIYILKQSTSPGTLGSITGSRYDTIELQYAGNNRFITISHEGDLVIQ